MHHCRDHLIVLGLLQCVTALLDFSSLNFIESKTGPRARGFPMDSSTKVSSKHVYIHVQQPVFTAEG